MKYDDDDKCLRCDRAEVGNGFCGKHQPNPNCKACGGIGTHATKIRGGTAWVPCLCTSK